MRCTRHCGPGEEPQVKVAHHVVAIEMDLPDTQRLSDKFMRDPEQYFVKALRRKSIEVSERKMTDKERKEFLGAKAVRPDRSQALKMRWILTYKLGENLGYHDPDYANRPTFAPTMTRTSRQLLLQYCAWQGFSKKPTDRALGPQ